MADRVIQRNDTAARWQSINPVLATGEIGIEIDGAKGYKIGDGKTRWNDLPYPANPTNVVQDLGNNENAVPSQKLVTEKLSELGSKVGDVSVSFPVKSGSSHSSNNDLIYIGGKIGDKITLEANSSDGNTDVLVAFYGKKENGESSFLVDCNLGVRKNITLSDNWDYIGVYVPSFADAIVTFSAVFGMKKEIELTNKEMSKNGMFTYFKSYLSPKFKIIESIITVTFPESLFRIYRESGDVVIETEDYANASFDLGLFDKLVINTITGVVSVKRISAAAETNDVVLLAYVGKDKVFSGLFEPYIIQWYDESVDKVLNESDLFLYFTNFNKPTISRNKTVVTIQFPESGSMRIYNKNFTYDYSVNVSGDSYEVPQGSVLVYDCKDNLVKIDSLLSGVSSNKYIPLFINAATYNDGGLLSHYMTNQTLSEMQSDVRLYESVSIQDSMSQTGNTISVDEGVITINKGFSLLYKARRYPILSPEPYYIRTLDDVNGTRVTRTYVYIDTSLLKADTSTYITGDNRVDLFVVSGNALIDNKKYLLFATFYYQMASGGLIDVYRNRQVSSSGIISLNPDSEFLPKFQSAKKRYYTSSDTSKKNPVVIAHLSDIHANWDNVSRFVEFTSHWKPYIDILVNTGDTVSDQYSDGIEKYAQISGAENIINVVGNHDTLSRDTGKWREHIGIDAYNMLINPFVSNWGVVQPDNANVNGYCYFYKDFVENSLRVAFVDIMAYGDIENTWLNNVLSDALSKGYNVLIATHFAGSTDDGSKAAFEKIDSNYTTLYELGETSSGLNSYNPNAYPMMAAVQTFMDNGGVFVGYIQGHYHADFVAKVAEYPQQLIYSIGGTKAGEMRDYNHIVGTRNQDEFQIISVDTYLKTVKLYKVGANVDLYGRHKNSICVNYQTGEVVAESY